MDPNPQTVLPKTRRKPDITIILRKSWYHLRLSMRHPSRVPTWDAIVLTAASPEQAQLYDWQLKRAKRMGRIAPSTITLTVPDPEGQRIGSGAATLNAIHALTKHTELVVNGGDGAVGLMGKKHILLLHAGGDSKRVPWANPMGKVFLPLPFLAADNPDGPVPLLFDHILAIASYARQAFKNEGKMNLVHCETMEIFCY